MRLDKLLVSRGLYSSREKAQFAINQGSILVNGQIVDKPSKDIEETATIEIFDIFNKFVSRGGLKLEKAIDDFHLDFSNKEILDIGASTGGFTDCALQKGAQFVFAVDVGTQQLHESLKSDTRVQFLENQDFRTLTPEQTNHKKFDYIVSDLSFISLTYIIPFLKPFLKDKSEIIFLIKPQFEAGNSFLNKSGIVTDEKGYRTAIEKVVKEGLNFGLYLKEISISTLWEKNKNVEFLALFSQEPTLYRINYEVLFDSVKSVKKNL
ncbi:MAG: TlyA family rRNA (cytidine-2'-O)-methyltransferase [Bacteroidetes bacterium HGW-Bacteroidetes-19]|nr:MAG: TlyA family rRNA (cytidine-2'-O)-methyltransferase [Bacteroidetes bacterium HGW-Bacteroidetes-19]